MNTNYLNMLFNYNYRVSMCVFLISISPTDLQYRDHLIYFRYSYINKFFKNSISYTCVKLYDYIKLTEPLRSKSVPLYTETF